MGKIRFWLISIVSFITVTIGTIFVPGSFLSRVFSVTFCTLLSFNSTFCTANLWSVSERVMAANTPTIEIKNNPLDNITYLAQQQSSSSPILLKQGTLQTGGSLLPDQRLFDSYNFSGRAGQSIVITLESQDFDTYLQLLDAQGKKIAENDNISNKNTNSTIKITLPSNGVYRVIVTSHDAKGKGRYTLTVSSATTEGCKIVLNTKNIDGKPFPDTVQYISNDKKTCGNSFTSTLNLNGNGATVVENTDTGPVTHQIENLPRKTQVTTKYPDGSTDSFSIEPLDPPVIVQPLDPGGSGRYRITFKDRGDKTQTDTITIPNNLKENPSSIPPSGDGANRDQSRISFCKVAREFCKEIHDYSDYVTNAEIAIIFSAAWTPFALPALGVLGLFDIAFTVYQDACFGIVGGNNIPVLPFSKLIKKFATKFDDFLFDKAVKKAYNEIGEKAAEQAKLGTQLDTIREQWKDYGLSAPCKELVEGGSNNDPHLTTFDGFKYDMQTVGEFTLIKSNNSAFEVQARQTPYNNSGSLSINSAVAVKVGSDRVALYAQGLPDADTTTPLRLNGKPTTIQGEKLALTGGGQILKQGGTYVISAPTGEKVLVSSNGSFLNVSPFVYKLSSTYSGLLGNVNGKPNDDLQIRGGSNILEARSTYGDVSKVLNQVGLRLPGVLDRAEKVYFDQLYKEFANSWRVKQEESLFDYPPGKTTTSYLNPGFPDKYLTLNMLSADQIQKAQKACTEAKVTSDLMEGCIFDVGFSGFSEFARTTAEITGYVQIVNQLFPRLNIPTPERAVERLIEKVKPRCLPFLGCH